MTDIRELVTGIEGSDEFKEFRKEHPDWYLVHVFNSKGKTELGYYDKKTDKIATVETEPFNIRAAEEVFKESGTLKELKIEVVKIDLEAIKEIVKSYQEEKYPAHPVQQEILILQSGPVWNCTLITQTLNMLLLQIDAVSGDVQKGEIRNILDLRKE